MFRVVLDAVLGTFAPASQDCDGLHVKRRKLKGVDVETSVPLPLDTAWLPGVQQWLPGSWTDIAISNKAVKSDNAAVDFFPWNQRIQLLFPCPHGTIVAFDEVAMQPWRRSFAVSFFHYLISKHGSNWSSLLNSGGPGSDHICDPAGKCRKVVLGRTGRTMSENKVGGEYGKKGGGNGSKDGCDLAELKRDVVKGQLVLQQVLQSK